MMPRQMYTPYAFMQSQTSRGSVSPIIHSSFPFMTKWCGMPCLGFGSLDQSDCGMER